MTPVNSMPQDQKVDGWEFFHPTCVFFGSGSRVLLPERLSGGRVLAVSSKRGRQQFEADEFLGQLSPSFAWMDRVLANPSIDDIETARKEIDLDRVDVLVAFGGGSAIDFAKTLSVFSSPHTRDLSVTDAIRLGPDLEAPERSPVVALPTTSGTGAEVTPFATVWDKKEKRKHSLSTPLLFPEVAIVDPRLTDSLPLDTTISAGIDALNQAFESLWNKNRTPLTKLFASRSIALGVDALRSLNENAEDHRARDKMSEASLLAGMAIAKTRTSICHSISYPLTAHFGVPHGVACGFSMVAVMEWCLNDAPHLLSPTLRDMGCENEAEVFRDISQLISELGISEKVRQRVPGIDSVIAVSSEMQTLGRSDNFPMEIKPEKLLEVLRRSFEG